MGRNPGFHIDLQSDSNPDLKFGFALVGPEGADQWSGSRIRSKRS
jgi:hypothetical protein